LFEKTISDRVRLALIDSAHAEELYATIDRNRDHLRPWLGWVDKTNAVGDLAQFVISARGRYQESGDITAVILCDGEPSGCIGLGVDSKHLSSELDYWLSQDYQGKGIITQCCRGMLEHAFEVMGLNRVQVRISPANERSKAVARRLGFTYEGTLRQVARINDEFEDLECHSLLREQWLQARK
jgi:ribosomal-protein-serine acetyltransferase